MKLLSKIDSVLIVFFETVMTTANIVICAMLLIGAFMRYVLHKDFYGMEELVLMVAFWMYFVGSAVATREESQVSADLVSSMLKNEKASAIMTLVRTVLTLILFGVLTKWAWDYLAWSLAMRPTSAVFKLPMTIAHSSLFFSFFMSVLYELKHVCHAVVVMHKAFGPKEDTP